MKKCESPFDGTKKHCFSPIPLHFCDAEYFDLFCPFDVQIPSTAWTQMQNIFYLTFFRINFTANGFGIRSVRRRKKYDSTAFFDILHRTQSTGIENAEFNYRVFTERALIFIFHSYFYFLTYYSFNLPIFLSDFFIFSEF